MGFEVLEGLAQDMRAERDARYRDRRYMVRVITETGLTGFINPAQGDESFQPAKKNGYRYVELKNAVDTRNIAAQYYKSAWIIIDTDTGA